MSDRDFNAYEREAARAAAERAELSAMDHANNDDRDRSHGEFFAVDLRAFVKVCSLKSINAAVAYLVMARGTGGDNRTTSWSVNAIEHRTGISRPRAKAAVDFITANRLASVGGTKTRPRYKLLPPPGVPEDYEPDWTWLPNALVDPGEGKGLGALSPVERLRKVQDIETLRLFVTLYNSQSLANDGGLDWREGGIRVPYERKFYTRVGALNIWGFDPAAETVESTAAFALRHRLPDGTILQAFWSRLNFIRNLGLLEFVPHLMDGAGQEAEIIHPIAPDDMGEEVEQLVWSEADTAVRTMLSEGYVQRIDQAGHSIIVPVPITSPWVAVVGIGRLRYRARTHATAKWFRDMNDRCEEACARYRAYARGDQRADAA